MSPQDDGWIDEDVGPVSRPYTVTGGRTRSHGDLHFDLIDIVVATGAQPRRAFSLAPEHLRILGLSQRPMAVAELAAAVGLPPGRGGRGRMREPASGPPPTPTAAIWTSFWIWRSPASRHSWT